MTALTRTIGPVDPDDFGTPHEPHDTTRLTPAQHEARHETLMEGHAFDVHQVATGIAGLAAGLPLLMDSLDERLDHAGMAEVAAWLGDARRRLAEVEADAVARLGTADGRPDMLTLEDGRLVTVRRGKDRKSWDHERWQHDARAVVAARADDTWADGLVDPVTGETVTAAAVVMPSLVQVEKVHGAGPPRVAAVRELGLDVDDYCQVSPGRWSIDVSAPAEGSGL